MTLQDFEHSYFIKAKIQLWDKRTRRFANAISCMFNTRVKVSLENPVSGIQSQYNLYNFYTEAI